MDTSNIANQMPQGLSIDQRNQELQRQQAETAKRPDVVRRQSIRERRAEQDARIRDDLASAEQCRRLIKREGQDGDPQTFQIAQGVLAAFNDAMKLKTALLLGDTGDSDEAFAARDQAIEALHAYLAELAERIDDQMTPIRESRAAFEIEQRELAQRQQEAQANQFARGMDARQVIEHLKIERHCSLRLNEHNQIEIAPADLATDMRVRALIRMHCNDLRAILKARQTYAVVDCAGFFDEANQ